MELVGAVDGTGGLQQIERRLVRALGGQHHGLVLGAVLVGLEQDAVELLAHRRRQRLPFGHQRVPLERAELVGGGAALGVGVGVVGVV